MSINRISTKFNTLGLVLPQAAGAVGNYVPRLHVGSMVYISGQLPMADGKPAFVGQVQGESDHGVAFEDAIKAAELCAVNIIAQIAASVDDDLDRVAQIVRLGGFVHCATDFTQHAQIINGASNLMVAVFGEKVGKHVRAATGASSLPFGVPVEVEASLVIKT